MNLPYEYVIEAYSMGNKMRQASLHEDERPIAMLTSMTANAQRDPKRKKEPFTLEDFFLYQPREAQDVPAERYGAAAMGLVKRRMLPSWALTFYAKLAAGAGGVEPALLAFIGEDFLLLAPIKTQNGYSGLLIAMETASRQIRRATSPCGKTVTICLPEISTKIIAEEGHDLRAW